MNSGPIEIPLLDGLGIEPITATQRLNRRTDQGAATSRATATAS